MSGALRRFVARGEEHEVVEVLMAYDRDDAIRRYCHPSLNWEAFEQAGWTIGEEPNGTEPVGIRRMLP